MTTVTLNNSMFAMEVQHNITDIQKDSLVCLAPSDVYFKVATGIAVIGIILNILFIYVLRRIPSMKTTANIYLVNLAVADLLLLISVLVYYVFVITGGMYIVKNVGFICYMTIFQNLLFFTILITVIIISIERHVGICYPLRFRNSLTKKRATTMVVLSWLLGVLFSIPRIIECFAVGNTRKQAQNVTYALYIILFSIALLVLPVMYFSTARSFRKFVRQLESDHGIVRRSDERQILVTAVSITTVFFLCMTPTVIKFIDYLNYNITGNSSADVMAIICIYDLSRWLLITSLIVNPILYNVISSTGREAFIHAFGCREPVQSRTTAATTTTSIKLNTNNINLHK
ncbi:neuromedin-U receptor 2-like [Saccoglossus kowalevskii]|uniref:Neuromedin-U receptor 2-like n=1 Tax=Saccoglossus kowalevskii TaxID=10224 RepID=A0ABM0LW13_SACKO|nr:PREDICTED: neuromedin-U receptor 2-like [Saccoglossus kowalevskii]